MPLPIWPTTALLGSVPHYLDIILVFPLMRGLLCLQTFGPDKNSSALNLPFLSPHLPVLTLPCPTGALLSILPDITLMLLPAFSLLLWVQRIQRVSNLRALTSSYSHLCSHLCPYPLVDSFVNRYSINIY